MQLLTQFLRIGNKQITHVDTFIQHIRRKFNINARLRGGWSFHSLFPQHFRHKSSGFRPFRLAANLETAFLFSFGHLPQPLTEYRLVLPHFQRPILFDQLLSRHLFLSNHFRVSVSRFDLSGRQSVFRSVAVVVGQISVAVCQLYIVATFALM